jgi:hypothetical protein
LTLSVQHLAQIGVLASTQHIGLDPTLINQVFLAGQTNPFHGLISEFGAETGLYVVAHIPEQSPPKRAASILASHEEIFAFAAVANVMAKVNVFVAQMRLDVDEPHRLAARIATRAQITMPRFRCN